MCVKNITKLVVVGLTNRCQMMNENKRNMCIIVEKGDEKHAGWQQNIRRWRKKNYFTIDQDELNIFFIHSRLVVRIEWMKTWRCKMLNENEKVKAAEVCAFSIGLFLLSWELILFILQCSCLSINFQLRTVFILAIFYVCFDEGDGHFRSFFDT